MLNIKYNLGQCNWRTILAIVFIGCFFGQASYSSPSESIKTAGATVDTTPADILKLPLFDNKEDGPLLTKIKTVELQTNAGPITIELDPTLAPINATYMYKLFSCGAFDGTRIHRYEPDFVIQINNIWEKAAGIAPLSDNLRAKLRRVPLEVSTQKANELNHHKYVLSMAHYDGGPDSGAGSFSMLVGDAPHLDHQYTIFGKVDEDADTLATLSKIENNWASDKYWITGANIK